MPLKTDGISRRYIFNSDSVFDKLPENVKKDFLQKMVIKKLKKGQDIFLEGSFPSGIFFIKKGKIKKYKITNGGKEQILYLCTNGELLGYASYLSDECYPDSASTLTEAEIGFISNKNLSELLQTHAELSKMLIKNLSHEFGVLINFIAAYTQKSVRERVALTLLILNRKFDDTLSEKGEIQITLSREDFSNIVGTAVETLVRILHDFKEEKLIKSQGRKIIIKDINTLLKIADASNLF